MPLCSDALVIGITGSLGSGASTLGEALRTHLGFETFALSHEIKQVWAQWKGAQEEPRRSHLQDMGNALRRSLGTNYLSVTALEKANDLGEQVACCAFDGIRNRAEAEFFRTQYRNFFLVAVHTPYNLR